MKTDPNKPHSFISVSDKELAEINFVLNKMLHVYGYDRDTKIRPVISTMIKDVAHEQVHRLATHKVDDVLDFSLSTTPQYTEAEVHTKTVSTSKDSVTKKQQKYTEKQQKNTKLTIKPMLKKVTKIPL